MRITEMLSREDFYSINKETINGYFDNDGTVTTLYIYPKLNAIVTAKPGKDVVRYLLREYSLRSFLKRVAAKAYIWICMKTYGMLASKTVEVHHKISNDTLIYPCNKKYRLFEFDKGVVSAVIKSGFGTNDLLHEIEFRRKQEKPFFIPDIINLVSGGYSERIIDGISLARINCREKYNAFKERAYDMFRNAFKKYDRKIDLFYYVQELSNRIRRTMDDSVDNIVLNEIINYIAKKCPLGNTITLGFSHGDFQPGNIWIEKTTNNVFIIDWESWGERSIWYDVEVLFGEMRPGDIRTYLQNKKGGIDKYIVILEDILFQLNELHSLPNGFGVNRFNDYINSVHRWVQEEVTNA